MNNMTNDEKVQYLQKIIDQHLSNEVKLVITEDVAAYNAAAKVTTSPAYIIKTREILLHPYILDLSNNCIISQVGHEIGHLFYKHHERHLNEANVKDIKDDISLPDFKDFLDKHLPRNFHNREIEADLYPIVSGLLTPRENFEGVNELFKKLASIGISPEESITHPHFETRLMILASYIDE